MSLVSCKHCGSEFSAKRRKFCSRECRKAARHGANDGSRLHRIWRNARNRCYNKNVPCYRFYGGRGIGMCNEWRQSYAVFKSWAMTSGYADNLSIDRIDVNRNYEPSNCRWITQAQQVLNSRKRDVLETSSKFKGVTLRRTPRKRVWESRATIGGRIHILGRFSSELLAALAYDDAAHRLHGEFARLNFPERFRTRTEATA